MKSNMYTLVSSFECHESTFDKSEIAMIFGRKGRKLWVLIGREAATRTCGQTHEKARVAKLVSRSSDKRKVLGSSPGMSRKLFLCHKCYVFVPLHCLHCISCIKLIAFELAAKFSRRRENPVQPRLCNAENAIFKRLKTGFCLRSQSSPANSNAISFI
jgi:hypothetical protein